MSYPIVGSKNHYHDDPTLEDVYGWADRWIALPVGATFDLHDVDQEAYRDGSPLLGPLIAANWMLNEGVLRWAPTKVRVSKGALQILGVRTPGYYLLKRVTDIDLRGIRDHVDFGHGTLLRDCERCGESFLCYKPMKKRRFCSSRCACANRVQRHRTQKRSYFFLD